MQRPEGRLKRSEVKLVSVLPGERQWVLNETQEAPPEYQEIIFHCKDDETLAQVTQRDCALCLLGNLQKPLNMALSN